MIIIIIINIMIAFMYYLNLYLYDIILIANKSQNATKHKKYVRQYLVPNKKNVQLNGPVGNIYLA